MLGMSTKTPMQTFLDAMPMAKEKHQNLIAHPGTACQIEFRLIHFSTEPSNEAAGL